MPRRNKIGHAGSGRIQNVRHARSCRIVWQAISNIPSLTIRAISKHTGLATSTVNRALHTLRDVYHYIDYLDGAENARRVLVPFVVAKEQH